MIWVIGIIVILLGGLYIYLKNLGIFSKIEVEEVDIRNMNIIYLEYVGDYKNIPVIFK